MIGFSRDEAGRLLVDGLDVAQIAEEFGTPSYIYSGDGFIQHFQQFSQAVTPEDAPYETHIHYAVKANSALAILSLLAKQGAGADIVSGGEMQRALAAGIPAAKIVFSGVGKSASEIQAALDVGIGQINAESPAELELIAAIAEASGKTAPVALRVNVNVDPGSHEKISTGQRSTKFGISTADGEAERLYKWVCEQPHLTARGLAVHIGSQLTNLAPFEQAYQALLELADKLRDAGYPVPNLDLGGGLGVDYHLQQKPDFAAYGQMIQRIFANRGYHLGFEPGRSIAADQGILVTRTLYLKAGADKQFIITDGAMNDLIRPTLYEAHHEVAPVIADKAVASDAPLSDIVGPVCETGDYLARGRKLPPVAANDLLAVFSAGAYGAVMMSCYNTRPEAAEILVYQGKAHLIRPRRSVADLLAMEDNPFAE